MGNPRWAGCMQLLLQAGAERSMEPLPAKPAVHQLARRMAMVIRCQHLIHDGAVAVAASLADIAGMTRARMTRILNSYQAGTGYSSGAAGASVDTGSMPYQSLRRVRMWPDPWSVYLGTGRGRVDTTHC
jgi:hypothetical protein